MLMDLTDKSAVHQPPPPLFYPSKNQRTSTLSTLSPQLSRTNNSISKYYSRKFVI